MNHICVLVFTEHLFIMCGNLSCTALFEISCVLQKFFKFYHHKCTVQVLL